MIFKIKYKNLGNFVFEEQNFNNITEFELYVKDIEELSIVSYSSQIHHPNKTPDEDFKKLADLLIRNKTITSFIVNNPSSGELQVSEQGITFLAKFLENNQTINKLRIINAKINIESAKSIAIMIKNNQYLTEIHFDKNELTNDAGIIIAEAIKNNKYITNFSVLNNQLSDEFAVVFQDVLSSDNLLKTVSLNGNYISDKAASALHAAKPKQVVLYTLNQKQPDSAQKEPTVVLKQEEFTQEQPEPFEVSKQEEFTEEQQEPTEVPKPANSAPAPVIKQLEPAQDDKAKQPTVTNTKSNNEFGMVILAIVIALLAAAIITLCVLFIPNFTVMLGLSVITGAAALSAELYIVNKVYQPFEKANVKQTTLNNNVTQEQNPQARKFIDDNNPKLGLTK